MLKWFAIFFVLAVILAVFGFGGVALGGEIGRILFFAFAAVLLALVIYGITHRCCRATGPPGGGRDDAKK